MITAIFYDIILFLVTPLGFGLAVLLLLFFQYVIFKSIMKDMEMINMKKWFNYTRNYGLKFIPRIFSKPQGSMVISKEGNEGFDEILLSGGITPRNYIKINNWFN